MSEQVEDTQKAIKTEGYRDLERQLAFCGHHLHRIWRQNDVAIYERSEPRRKPHELELVIVRKRKETMLPSGSVLPPSEAYPSASEWGKHGWSFPIKEREFVFSLARALVSIEENRPDFVRKKACYPKGFKAENQMP